MGESELCSREPIAGGAGPTEGLALLDRSGEGKDVNLGGAGAQEGVGALAEGRAGGEDVVDQKDAPAADSRGVADQKGTGHLGQPGRRPRVSQLARRPHAMKQMTLEARQVVSRRQGWRTRQADERPAGQLQRLIEAARAELVRVQRDGDDLHCHD